MTPRRKIIILIAWGLSLWAAHAMGVSAGRADQAAYELDHSPLGDSIRHLGGLSPL